MSGCRNDIPAIRVSTGTSDKLNRSHITPSFGFIRYDTTNHNLEVYEQNGWKDIVINDKPTIDISGMLVVDGDVSFNARLSVLDASFQSNVDISGNLIVAHGEVSFNKLLKVPDASFDNIGNLNGSSLQINTDVSFNNSVNITGNLTIDGSFSFSEVIKNITTISNEILISTQLDICNQGTGPALEVTQIGSGANNDVALFNSNPDDKAFEIKHDGKSIFYKDVSFNTKLIVPDASFNRIAPIDGSLVIMGDLSVNGQIFLSGGVVEGGGGGGSSTDASFNVIDEFTDGSGVTFLTDVSFNAHLSVLDASFQSNVDISGKLVVNDDVSFNGDLNMGFNRKEVIELAGAGGLNGSGGGEGTARASSSMPSNEYSAQEAFNNSLGDYDAWLSRSVLGSGGGVGQIGMPQWIEFEFPYDVIVTKYKIWRGPQRLWSGRDPKTWTLLAYPVGPRDRMYPPTRNLTSASHTISGQAYGNGTYKTHQSTTYDTNESPRNGYSAFNTSMNTGPVFANGQYNDGNGGNYITSNGQYLVDNYKGDWLTIELPVQINLTKYGFKQRSGYTNRAPARYKIYGSNDGSAWTELVHKTSDITYTGIDFEESISDIGMYKHFGLVVNKLKGNDTILNFDEWYIYGNEYDSVVIDDQLSDVDNWEITTADSITNNTERKEFFADTTTTAYRRFRLNVTGAHHDDGSWIFIGELAFYGYKPVTINTGNLTIGEWFGNKVNIGGAVQGNTVAPELQYKLDVNGYVRMNFGGDNGGLQFKQNGIYFEGINDGHTSGSDFAFIGRPHIWHEGNQLNTPTNHTNGNGDLIIYNGNNNDNDIYIYADAGGIATNTDGTNEGNVIIQNYKNTSDNRIKHNEEIITNALSDIRQLIPKKYWKTENVLYDENHNFELDISGHPIDSSGNRVFAYIEHGLIAQEVLKINSFNHLVSPPKERGIHRTYTLNYMSIFTHAIAAIKELDAEHTITKQELENEKAKTISLETQLEIYKNDISFIKIENTQLKTDISMIRTHLGI